ncbi:MAG: T9SS type A sorting domain-containing protein, partial [bacterium]|nr:T9SS type A sorting domain-containing protein [bacterium]
WDYNYDGYNYLGNDYWIVKLTSTGTMQWQTTLGGTGDDDAFSIQQTTDGGYVVAGMSSSTDANFFENNGNHDYWIVKLEANLLSTSSFQKEHIVIYPNPAKSTLNIQFPDDVLIDKIIIIDLTGRIIMEQTNNTKQIITEGLATGMYLIQAVSGEKK